MSIKTTETLTRKQAIDVIIKKELEIAEKQMRNMMAFLTNESLEDMLEEHEESEFTNYIVVNDDE